MYRLLFILITVTSIALAAQSACSPLELEKKTLLWGVTIHGYPVTSGMLARLEKETPYRFHWLVFFLQWPQHQNDGAFPWESLDAIWDRGVLPCITWEPFYITAGKEKTISAEAILAGLYDRYLKDFAEDAVRWRKPLIIRLAHEMNLKRYHWGGPSDTYGPDNPAIYRKLFLHVRSVFDRAGAQNVIWAFCPNAESIPNPHFAPYAPWNVASAYYPGNDAVDLLGMDGYNWGTTQTLKEHGWNSNWRSFQNIFEPLYMELSTLAPDKPVLVFETASVAAGGSKADWVAGMVRTAEDWGLLGISWFQANKEVDWRLNDHKSECMKLSQNGEPENAGQKWGWQFLKNRSGNTY